MDKISYHYSLLKKGIMLSLLVACCLFFIENANSRNDWRKHRNVISYDSIENSVTIKFNFFNYKVGSTHKNIFLKNCKFEYTLGKGKQFSQFMETDCEDQTSDSFVFLNMKNKKANTDLEFLASETPASGTKWAEGDKDVKVKYLLEANSMAGRADMAGSADMAGRVDRKAEKSAYLTVKWFLGTEYKDVKAIRISGLWSIDGMDGKRFKDIYKLRVEPMKPQHKNIDSTMKNVNNDLPSEKAQMDAPRNHGIQIFAHGDEIIIKGVEKGKTITVYNALKIGIVQSVTSTGDVVRLKLPLGQTYIVKTDKFSRTVPLIKI